MIRSAQGSEPFHDLLRTVDDLLASGAADTSGGTDYRDVLADLLGFLAGEMTRLNEERQREVDRFLDWLESQIGTPVAQLTGKTAVQEYYRTGYDAEKLIVTLTANRSKVRIDLSVPKRYGATNPARARIAEGYERSMSILRPLRQRLELTDRLIDQLVYRLYGLTLHQVDLVERTVPVRDHG